MGLSLEVTMPRSLAAVVAAVILAAQTVPAGEPPQCLQQLAGWLTGAFSSAAQAALEVTVSADGLVRRDRGFDSAGVQVRGAVKGGCVFDRVA
jgi:hypothetical protein